MAENSNNDITLELDVPQSGRIKVHTQIINDLSSGIYSSPASCIKELVNNSFDADAKNVTIRVKPVHDTITIIDDGDGMNAIDFDQKFAWISHSTKRQDSTSSKRLQRPLIGKIGIGFIAVNEICHELEITSSKEGEPQKFTANINFKSYFDEAQVDTEEESAKGIIKGEYQLVNESEEANEHYTIIRLIGLKDSVRDVLDDKQYLAEILRKKNRDYQRSTFSSMKNLMDYHAAKNLKSFSEDNAYIQFIIDLSSYIPVQYIEGGPIEGKKDKIIEELVKLHDSLDFKVDLDGIYLKKPIYFPKENYGQGHVSFSETLVVNEEDEENKEEIEVRGYFYMQHGILYPRELNGVAIRIKNIPIAEQFGFDDSFLKYPNYTNQLFRNWISGEIYVKRGLEEAMNIDRKSFRVTHPHYLVLQNFLHEYLSEIVFKKTLRIYEGAKDVRDEEKERERKEQGKKILKTDKVEYTKAPVVSTDEKTDADRGKDQKDKSEIAPIKIVKSSAKSTTVEVNQSIAKKFKKKDWEYLEDIFLIFEMAYKESKGDPEELRKLFYQKINEWKGIE